MKQILVVFTIDYPDPLFGNELPFLAKAFDKVYLLPTIVKPDYTVPENVEVVDIFVPANLRTPWRLLFKYFFKVVRIYGYTLLQPGNFKPYRQYYRSFLGHFFEEIEKVNALKKFIIQHKLSDALFYDYWLVNSTLALAELKREGLIKKIVARSHGFDLYDERQFEERVSFREYRVKYLDAVFTISKHGFDYLKAKLPSGLQQKVMLSYLGIQSNYSIPSHPRTENIYIVVSCARLIPLKRIALLAEVLTLTTLNIHWVHFGDGQEGNTIQEKIKKLPSNIRVSFYGEVKNEKVREFYANHYVDVFISLSESEGLPVSMMEATSFGIPIVAISTNGVPEIVTDTSGVLINVNSSKEQIRNILEHTLLHIQFDRSAIRQFFERKFEANKNYKDFINSIKTVSGMTLGHQEVERNYQQCTHCVLDTKDDPTIDFNAEGVCGFCLQYEKDDIEFVKKDIEGEQALALAIERIKVAGRGKQYDCILGISGGVDSTFLAYQAKKLGLKPLAVHFDNGWNSELAVKNIEGIVSKLDINLHTLVVDWNEFRDLQLAFFKASVIDIELATDHAMLATLYKLAIEKNIRFILSGHNVVTESILPKHWYYNKRDHLHIKAISKLFGTVPLKTYPLMTSRLKFTAEWKRIQTLGLLNFMPYNKAEVKRFITQELGWRDYGGKHYESIFTRFYQGYVLIQKFGVDKRKAHLSNLICSKQITREEALLELQKPPYSAEMQSQDYEFVLKKLNLTKSEFEQIMKLPVRQHTDYPVDVSIYDRFRVLRLLRPVWKFFKGVRKAVS